MGTHIVNVEGKLLKRRIKDKQVLSEEVIFLIKYQFHSNDDHHGHTSVDFKRLDEAFKNKEGCQLLGYIIVNKVPGTNFIL